MQIENTLIFLPIDEQIEFNQVSYLLSHISQERAAKIERYHFDIDKKLSLYSELLVRLIACEILATDNSDLYFETKKLGKPFIKGMKDFHFNISHTKNAVAVAFSLNEVGIDVEKVREFDEKIVKRFFTENEKHYVLSGQKNANQRFFEVWTKKEAYVKYLGDGLNMSMRSFDVLSPEIANNLITYIKEDYILTTCTEQKYEDFKIITLSEEKFIDDISKEIK